MKLQDLCECIKGTKHTPNKINVTSTIIVDSQVWPFPCYYNTLVKYKPVENTCLSSVIFLVRKVMHTWVSRVFCFYIKPRDLTSLSLTLPKYKTGVRLAFKLGVCRPMGIRTYLSSTNIE